MFKKTMVILVLCLMLALPAYAGKRKTDAVKMSTKSVVLLTPSTTTIYTLSMPFANLETNKAIGVFYKVTPDTADLQIQFEQSFQRPTTEGSTDSTYLQSHIVDASLTDNDWHLATIDTVKGTFGRFKIIGQGSNPSNAVLQMKVIK